ncbi:MAG: hypothetical protein WDO24_04140 [Pseudomonadota bacterium]
MADEQHGERLLGGGGLVRRLGTCSRSKFDGQPIDEPPGSTMPSWSPVIFDTSWVSAGVAREP